MFVVPSLTMYFWKRLLRDLLTTTLIVTVLIVVVEIGNVKRCLQCFNIIHITCIINSLLVYLTPDISFFIINIFLELDLVCLPECRGEIRLSRGFLVFSIFYQGLLLLCNFIFYFLVTTVKYYHYSKISLILYKLKSTCKL